MVVGDLDMDMTEQPVNRQPAAGREQPPEGDVDMSEVAAILVGLQVGTPRCHRQERSCQEPFPAPVPASQRGCMRLACPMASWRFLCAIRTRRASTLCAAGRCASVRHEHQAQLFVLPNNNTPACRPPEAPDGPQAASASWARPAAEAHWVQRSWCAPGLQPDCLPWTAILGAVRLGHPASPCAGRRLQCPRGQQHAALAPGPTRRSVCAMHERLRPPK